MTKSAAEKGFPSIVHCVDLGGMVVFLPSLIQRRENVKRLMAECTAPQVCVGEGPTGKGALLWGGSQMTKKRWGRASASQTCQHRDEGTCVVSLRRH